MIFSLVQHHPQVLQPRFNPLQHFASFLLSVRAGIQRSVEACAHLFNSALQLFPLEESHEDGFVVFISLQNYCINLVGKTLEDTYSFGVHQGFLNLRLSEKDVSSGDSPEHPFKSGHPFSVNHPRNEP